MKKRIRHFFVPHANNLYRPHAFRHKAVSIYSVGLILSHFAFGVAFDSATVTAQVVQNLNKQIIEVTNSKRLEKKLPQLKENKLLSLAAESRAKDMFDNNYWDHVSPDGREPWDFIKSVGYEYSYAGENLAKGFSEANNTVNAWMSSPTHRDNLLNSNYEEIGVAVYSGRLNGRNTTIIVQLFASPFERGIKPVTVLGSKSELTKMDISNIVTASNLPYTLAWIGIVVMLFFDALMLIKQGHHKDKHHRFHIGAAVVLLALLFGTLTVNIAYIY
jgi:uncharacterized protein YkwD